MIHFLRTMWGNFSYFLAALAVALTAYFLSRERPKELPVPSARPALTGFAPGSYTFRSGLMAASASLAACKNTIEKKLESGYGKVPFTARDSDAIGGICRDLEKLFREMRGAAAVPDRASRIEAADAERRTLVLENAKLKALLKGGGGVGRAAAQLAAVEKSLFRLQLHLEGLAALEAQ